MPRKIIQLVTGEVYHVFNRGVDKRVVFKDTYDYIRFYNSLSVFNVPEPTINFRLAESNNDSIKQKLVDIYAYNLLPNHFHLILRQSVDSGISEFMKRVSGGYTSYFNDKHRRSGALFQGTYKRVHVASEQQLRYIFAYVNENHIVHQIERESQIFHTSSIHFQKKAKSKLISTSKLFGEYDLKSSESLVKQIADRRTLDLDMEQLYIEN